MAEHWQLKPGVSWVRLPATAGFSTFLYFRLITSKFIYVFSLLAGSVKGCKKKLPTTAVPIFSPSSGSGLFDDEEEEEEEESEDGREGVSPLESSSSGGLFEEDADDMWMITSSKGRKGVLVHVCVLYCKSRPQTPLSYKERSGDHTPFQIFPKGVWARD